MKLNIVKYHKKLFFSIFTSLIVLFCANYSIAADNLLENPGAEDGTAFWTQDYGPDFEAVTEFTPTNVGYKQQEHGGNKFWYGGDAPEDSAMYQDEDVSKHAGTIDGGGVKAFLSGWLAARYHWAQLSMKFLDGGGNEVGSIETGYKTGGASAPAQWTKYSLEEYLPIGTRTIRVLMQAKHKDGYGIDNEVYFDDLSLTLALPELSKVNVPDKLDFGNLYLETETNSSLADYNKSITEPISFKNSGDEMSKLNWSLGFSRADTDNLITNPGAENSTSLDLNGWENDGTAFTARWSPSGSHSGNKYFYGGDNNAESYAYQDIDVSSYSSEIDAGNMTATYSGGIRNYNGSDEGILELYFYDASMNELTYHHSGWHSHVDWKRYAIEDKLLPTGTRTVRVRMRAKRYSGSNNDGYFDDLRLTLKWTSCQGEAMFSESSGSLDKDATQTVTTWLEGFSGAPGDRSGLIVLSTGRGYAEIGVSAKAWRITQISHKSPEKGSNDKVNVALNDSVSFVLNSTSTHPDATVVYRWQKRSAGEAPGSGFDQTSGAEKYYNFTDPGGYTIYCKAVEKIGSKEIETDLLEIPVQAWNRPVVKDTPPQANIGAGDVSWFNGKYAGVRGQPVRLMADGSTQNTPSDGEEITKYLWSFDPDWDIVELEQPAGEVVSYTWDNPKDDKIRCKAVTNYGVESEEKLFDLKVYDTLQVNPGGTYNGRVNTSIELDGSLENSYPGAKIKYQWRVDSATPGGEIKNNATHQGNHIELTQAVDNQNGQIEYAALPLSDDWSVTGEFWTGGGDGADAFYIYVWANGTPTGEAQDRGQYSIIFDEYTDEIQLYGAPNFLKSVAQPIPIDNSEWRPFRVVFYKGEFEVYLDHQLKLEYDDSANYETRMNNPANNLFGFGARTGGQNNYHRVRNMEWTTGDPVDTTTQGEAEHTWTAEDTYLAGLTVRVTTSERLVLEDTEFVEVRVEAGVPTAMPGGPYRGGIAGGNYSPVPFEGNHPDFVEADDVGVIEDWVWFFSDGSNGALELDGQDDRVIVDPIGDFPTTEITAEFWMKSSDDARAGTPISYASSQHTNDFIIIYDYRNFALYVAGVSTGATGVSANDGEWHHIALTWESSDGTLKFYKDGVVECTKTIAQSLSFASGGAFVLGQEQDSIGGSFDRDQAFAGTIDDVRIWNVVRSGDAIRENMGRELTGGEDGLVLYWRFEEGENTAVNDQSSYGNDGELVVTNDGDPEAPDNRWVADGHPAAVHGIWNPIHSYEKAGDYEASLKVFSASGKWSAIATTDVEIIDGKVAGYVRAADLRTPVREVRLTLTSSHVTQDALARVAAADDNVNTTDEGGLWTETDGNGYYEFEHLPLGSYRIVASKGSGDSAHEFETKVKATELTLDAPNQLAIDFVDLSVFPVGGQIVYSIQKDEGQNVLVEGVQVTAQPVGSTSGIRALPSAKSLSPTNTNYSLPLFAGKYLFLAEKEGRDIRIDEDTPGYDSKTGLVTIEDAITDVDFVDHTSYELTVFVEDSGGYNLSGVTVTISGENGQAKGQTDENDGKFVATLNPGEYTVTVDGAMPKGEKEEKPAEVDLTGGNEAVTMVIPSKIEVSFGPRPKLLDVAKDFMDEFGLKAEDNPEGYIFYYPPSPVKHTYTITATSNGHPVGDFTLYVDDEISMMTDDAPEEQMMEVIGEEAKFTVKGGRPKTTDDDLPLAAPKRVTFRVVKDGYEDSDPVEDEVIVLGDVPVGTAAKIVAIPSINYTVLHDPPGDGSYSYLDDTVTLRGFVKDMQIKVDEYGIESVDVYPSHWDSVKEIEDWDDADKEDDLEDKGLLGDRDPENMTGYFVAGSVLEVGTQSLAVFVPGALGWFFKFAKLGTSISKFATGGAVLPGVNFVQYEISADTRLQTPSGDTLPDILGPGKGDIYFGEGWTLGLQTKYRLGIECLERESEDGPCLDWQLTTAQIETYDILGRSNQYIYTTRDIENIIVDLDQAIQDADDEFERGQLEGKKYTWEKLLNNNLAYKWNKDYVSQGKSVDDFINDHDKLTYTNGKAKGETLIFSAGPSFEYSRTISEGDFYTYRTNLSIGSHTSMKGQLVYSAGTWAFGNGVLLYYQLASDIHMSSDHSLINEWEDGTGVEQTVGFALQDDDVGDNIATRVLTDPRWGTPLFFQEAGSRTSDPWEAGTNKAVDVTLEMVEDTTETFDYHEGAHYTIKVKYTGERDLESLFQTIDFNLYAPQPDNQDTLSVRFNGTHEPYIVRLNKEAKSATIAVSLYPPEKDQNNSEEKQYQVKIVAQEIADQQITRELILDPTFADLQAPRAVITAPYEGERISPVFFPADNPFEIEVVSEDTDLASIQLQIRSKQPDGVWEPWRNLSGMLWQDGVDNPDVVTVFDRLDRKPPRREFTFKWAEDAISTLGVGEYALRAIATDKATPSANVDIDPPYVVFLVDDAKPSVLNSIPDYQARESERIYRGELSVTFTDDMRSTDFNDRTFYVMNLLDDNKKVSGYVSYSPALRKTVFVPIVPFQPNGFYRVEIKTDIDKDSDGVIDEQGVHDLAGNPLDNAFMWTFRTTDAPFEPTWSMNWRVTDGIDTDANNITSVEYGGLDDEDEKDVRAVPSLASQMRMCFLNRDKIEFDRDIRPADGRLAHHWFFVVDNVQQGSTVTLEYQPSVKLTKTTRQYQVIRLVEFDQDSNVSNTITLDPTQAQTDPNTGEISFVQAYQYTNQGERSRYFRLDVQKVSFVAGKFEKGTSGWKFLSVPITPQRAEPFVNLGDDIDPFQLFQYDTGLSGYKVYPYDIGEVSLQTGHGYFTRLETDVDANQDAFVNVDVGGSMNSDDVRLELDAAGWHAIGNPFILPVDVADLVIIDGTDYKPFDDAVTAEWVEDTLYRWDTILPSEADTASLAGSSVLSDSYKLVTSWSLICDGSDGEPVYCDNPDVCNTAPTECVDKPEFQLNPWDGYWLKTNRAGLKIKIPAPADLPDTPPTPDYLIPPMAPASHVEQAVSLPAEQFNLKLTLTSKFASDLTTTLGTHQNAKSGKDSFDQSEPPTLSKTVAVYFDHSDWEESGRYNRDIQTALKVGEQRTWKFTVYTDNQDAEMRLSWEKAIAQVPDDIMLYFRRLDTNTQHATRNTLQDMREVQSVDLISHSRITEIPFEVRAERFEMSPLEDLQVIAGEKQVTIKWAANDNTFIDGYVIERTGQEGETSRFELPPTHSLTRLPTHEFVDTDVKEEATYTYQVTIHFKSGAELQSDLFTVTVLPVIKKTVLLQSYPNPFNPDVWIPYELENDTAVTIEIYNAAGQLVRTLDLGRQPRGRYISKSKAARWDGRTEIGERAASGLYFYVLKAGDFTATRKMAILK